MVPPEDGVLADHGWRCSGIVSTSRALREPLSCRSPTTCSALVRRTPPMILRRYGSAEGLPRLRRARLCREEDARQFPGASPALGPCGIPKTSPGSPTAAADGRSVLRLQPRARPVAALGPASRPHEGSSASARRYARSTDNIERWSAGTSLAPRRKRISMDNEATVKGGRGTIDPQRIPDFDPDYSYREAPAQSLLGDRNTTASLGQPRRSLRWPRSARKVHAQSSGT